MDIQYHEVNLDMWISSTLWKELVLLNQIAQFHVEIKLRGAKHQTPSIQLHGHFVWKLIQKKYFKTLYTNWERWKSCKKYMPQSSFSYIALVEIGLHIATTTLSHLVHDKIGCNH